MDMHYYHAIIKKIKAIKYNVKKEETLVSSLRMFMRFTVGCDNVATGCLERKMPVIVDSCKNRKCRMMVASQNHTQTLLTHTLTGIHTPAIFPFFTSIWWKM